MTTEKFANLAESTLAVAYAGGGGTIQVVSASGFPTSGNFRVRLGNGDRTLLKVTSVAGAVFTVSVEANDGPAPSGVAVVLVNTAGAEDARKADLIQLANYASIPATEKPGIIVLPNDGVYLARDNGAGFNFFGMLAKLKPIDTSTLAWINQGTATVETSKGLTRLNIIGAVSQLRLFKKAVPVTPYTLTVVLMPRANTTSYSGFGIAFRESATGKLILHQIVLSNVAPTINTTKYNSPSSFNSTAASQSLSFVPNLLYLQMKDDGVNITFLYSFDGVFFNQLFQEARGAFFTTGPDEYGIAAECSQTAEVVYFSLVES